MVRGRWISGFSVVTLLVVACGGVSSREDEVGGAAGEAGNGGSDAGKGASGAGNGGSDAGRAGSGGTRAGSGGSDAGTGGLDGQTCSYAGKTYVLGERFPAGDGCNTCTCLEQGVSCTQVACNRCLTIENEYATAQSAAKACDPALSIDQCTKPIPIGLNCGCTTFINPDHAEAEAKLADLARQYSEAGCGGGVICGACEEPLRAFCSPEGACEDDTGAGSGAGGTGSGTGGAPAGLESCPEAPLPGTPCTGEFTCSYEDICNCGACCSNTYACVAGTFAFVESVDACHQIPC